MAGIGVSGQASVKTEAVIGRLGRFISHILRIELPRAAWIAAAKVVCQQGTPSGAETNARLLYPLLRVAEVGGAAEVARVSSKENVPSVMDGTEDGTARVLGAREVRN
jgi:hypothetical protein